MIYINELLPKPKPTAIEGYYFEIEARIPHTGQQTYEAFSLPFATTHFLLG